MPLRVRIREYCGRAASRIACPTRSGVAGIERSWIPSDRNASGKSVDHGRRRADRAGFSNVLDTERIGCAWNLGERERKAWQVVSTWHRIVNAPAIICRMPCGF